MPTPITSTPPDSQGGPNAKLLIRTAIYSAIVPGAVTIFGPYLYLWAWGRGHDLPVGALGLLGIPAILIGVAIYLWCAWNFVNTGRGTPNIVSGPTVLVVRGLYRYVRNPMYLATLLILIGEALLLHEGILLVYAAECLIFLLLCVHFFEEPALRRRFGAAYERYCETTPRWVPWPGLGLGSGS